MIASTSGGVLWFFKIGLRRVSSCTGQFAAGVVKLLEAIETVARVAHHFLQAWLTLPSCLANSSSPTLARMIFCSWVIVGVLSKRRGRARPNPMTPRPASASASAITPTVRLSLNYCISTHSLFYKMDRELYAKLQKAGDELIIDEVLETVTIYKGLDPDDLQVMLNEEMVSIDPRTRRLDWNQAKWPNYAGEFLRIRQLCETGSLVVFRDKTFIWEFPSEFLRCFSR